MAKAGEGLLHSWASSVVRSPKLGPGWDTTGPGIAADHYEPARHMINIGNSFSEALEAESSDVSAG